MIKQLKEILDKILLGFWIAFGVVLFQFCYAYIMKIINKLIGFSFTV